MSDFYHRTAKECEDTQAIVDLCITADAEVDELLGKIKELEVKLSKAARCISEHNEWGSIQERKVQMASARIKELEDAVSGVNPWLSSSLEENDCCDSYKEACDLMFKVVWYK